MNKRTHTQPGLGTLSAIVLASFFFLRGSAYPFAAGLYKVSDKTVSPRIDFETVSSSREFNTAKQFLKLDNPENAPKTIRIYTNNPNWIGDAADRSGLVYTANPSDRMPLYWSLSNQSAGMSFAPENESGWTTAPDINNSNFSSQRDANLITLKPNSVSYVYFGAKIPESVPAGSYKTKLVVESIDGAPASMPMAVSNFSCNRVLLSKSVLFKAIIENTSDMKSANFHYRYKGEAAYKNMAMKFSRAWGAGQWLAQVSLPSGGLHPGVLEYYYDATDGSTVSSAGSTSAPFRSEVVAEFAELLTSVSPAPGRVSFLDSDCSLTAKAPELTFQQGSIDKALNISAKKLEPTALPLLRNMPALSAYDFSPEGLKFNKPVTLTMSYADADRNGIVDGTGFEASALNIFWFDGIEWRNLGGTVDTANQTVNATVSHFSTYALFPAGALTAEEVRPLESIVTPNGDGVNDFAQFGISGSFEIHIFSIQGRRIRKLENNNVWDGKDDDGTPVESGAYIYQVRSDRIKVSGQIGVAR